MNINNDNFNNKDNIKIDIEIDSDNTNDKNNKLLKELFIIDGINLTQTETEMKIITPATTTIMMKVFMKIMISTRMKEGTTCSLKFELTSVICI